MTRVVAQSCKLNNKGFTKITGLTLSGKKSWDGVYSEEYTQSIIDRGYSEVQYLENGDNRIIRAWDESPECTMIVTSRVENGLCYPIREIKIWHN